MFACSDDNVGADLRAEESSNGTRRKNARTQLDILRRSAKPLFC